MLVVSVTFYFGTVGVLGKGIDSELSGLSVRLVRLADQQGIGQLAEEIGNLLNDGIASDTEIYLLVGADGARMVGNVRPWNWTEDQFGHLSDQALVRVGRPSVARVLPVRLPGGEVLVVGRDMPDQQKIRRLVVRAIVASGAVAAVVATLGALFFHRRIEQRLSAIRNTAARIESGQFDWRIPPSASKDEFSRLDGDINRMLDRIQQLMEGVRHVSNAIAHDLRTPLGRIRARLDEALRRDEPGPLREAAGDAIGGIDQLTVLFERLLQIAEAESGARRQSFVPVPLAPLIVTLGELYDALAEEQGMRLDVSIEAEATVLGDRALLSALLANLLENAFKYAAVPGSRVELSLRTSQGVAQLAVRDEGPGIPGEERPKVLERFYRLDRSRSLPGNGLGLPLAAAIAVLHDGALDLGGADPGLEVVVTLPLHRLGNLSKP